MNDLYGGLITAMDDVKSAAESTEDIKVYRERLAEMNGNLASINKVYGGMLAAMKG